MMGAFDVLNHPYSVKKVAITQGYTDQTTGEWVPETTTETAISAHVSNITLKELQYLDPGIVALGMRKLACAQSIGLIPGDRVKITEIDGTTETEWIVQSKMVSSGLLNKHSGISRETFLLKRKI